MRREIIRPRANWQAEVESIGFGFHTIDGQPYWREDACYVFDADAIDEVETATGELHAMCLEAVDRIVRGGRYDALGIDEHAARLAERSWFDREPSLYGRMDLSWDGVTAPRLLEYNADTPTSLFEASVVQWYWLEACYPDADQFNSIHEKLIERWPRVGGGDRVHFAACYDNPEDGTTTDYLLDTCVQAGHEVQALDIEEIGWNGRAFIDLADRPIDRLFKLYPWEWMLDETFSQHIAPSRTRFIEPAWKMLLSNKAILPLLWEWFPDHPNLLPASLRREDIAGPAVAKPSGVAKARASPSSTRTRVRSSRRIVFTRRWHRCRCSMEGTRWSAHGSSATSRRASASAKTTTASRETPAASCRIALADMPRRACAWLGHAAFLW